MIMKPIYDVVVAGGGTAGCVAAISAARHGARVCLVEQTAMLGGNGTSGLVTQIFGPKEHFGGIGMELIDRLHKRGGVSPTVEPGVYWWVPYRNEVLKRLWDAPAAAGGKGQLTSELLEWLATSNYANADYKQSRSKTNRMLWPDRDGPVLHRPTRRRVSKEGT